MQGSESVISLRLRKSSAAARLDEQATKGLSCLAGSLGGSAYSNVIATAALFMAPVPDAQALQGAGPEAFVAAGTLVRYSFTLNGGETREVAANEALKLTAHCIDNGADQNGNPGKDVARIYATTTQDGAVMAAVDSFDGGATGYLNAATAETDAVWSETAADDGVVKAFNGSDDDLAVASAPDGATMSGLP